MTEGGKERESGVRREGETERRRLGGREGGRKGGRKGR